MGGPKGPLARESPRPEPGGREDPRDLDTLFRRRVGQQRGERAGEEALARPGRSREQERVPPDRAGQHPIEWAARGVQEDLCLLERDDTGWRFTAAAVCFPTRWSPAEKVGLGLRAVCPCH